MIIVLELLLRRIALAFCTFSGFARGLSACNPTIFQAYFLPPPTHYLTLGKLLYLDITLPFYASKKSPVPYGSLRIFKHLGGLHIN
jgi:hypothetical protein|nr:MAG TPA: hypothetical protein [Caudoviricetes sp.]